MGALTVRKTRPEDIDRLLEIYDIAKKFMRAHDNPNQWLVYPQRHLLEEDVRAGKSYVCLDGDRICGTFVLAFGEDPTYGVIDGEWLNDEEYATIHRIASDGTCRGVLRCALSFALDKINNVRMDTHPDNYVMQNAALALGFTRCGIIYIKDDVDDHSPRVAFQTVKDDQ